VERISSVEEMWQATEAVRHEGKVVGLVPTMGALHEGHMSLVRAACERSDVVAVSIFVNPTQFAPGEDYERYPRDLEGDMALLAAEGVDLVFTPSVGTMYAEGDRTVVDPGPLGGVLCGAARPGHFAGVATIVSKLFNACRPHLAFFGEKDFQQLVIVRRLARGLLFPVKVIGCPIVREPDGLAMSSRNAYLSSEERQAATALFTSLQAAKDALTAGECSVEALEVEMSRVLEGTDLVDPEYAVVVDPESLERLVSVDGHARLLVAAKVGPARLIDNLAIGG